MRFSILSLFPGYFDGPLGVSIIKRARENGLLQIDQVDIRSFATGKHRKVDDRPFGGGPGMVLMPGPVVSAIHSVKEPNSKVIYLSPQGTPLTAALCENFAKKSHLILLCGHYEGIDERVLIKEIDYEISIGDYVLTSGCPAAAVMVDAISRFIPGVLGHEDAAESDSFQEMLFDFPQYTQPDTFDGLTVPEILKSGHHEKIAAWRKEKALEKTLRVRPDLFD